MANCDTCGQPATQMATDLYEEQPIYGHPNFIARGWRYGCLNHPVKIISHFLDGTTDDRVRGEFTNPSKGNPPQPPPEVEGTSNDDNHSDGDGIQASGEADGADPGSPAEES